MSGDVVPAGRGYYHQADEQPQPGPSRGYRSTARGSRSQEPDSTIATIYDETTREPWEKFRVRLSLAVRYAVRVFCS